jgi:hypothetical protein
MYNVDRDAQRIPRRACCSADRALSERKARIRARLCKRAACRVGGLRRWPGSTDTLGEVFSASSEQSAVTDPDLRLIAATHEDFSALREVLSDVRGACAALPKAEQERYREAQQSVVDARRSAETHEGLLQVS